MKLRFWIVLLTFGLMSPQIFGDDPPASTTSSGASRVYGSKSPEEIESDNKKDCKTRWDAFYKWAKSQSDSCSEVFIENGGEKKQDCHSNYTCNLETSCDPKVNEAQNGIYQKVKDQVLKDKEKYTNPDSEDYVDPKDKDDDKDTPAGPPQFGDKKYCDFSDLDNDPAMEPDVKSMCVQLKLHHRMDQMKSDVDDLKKSLDSKQDKFDSDQVKLQEQMNQCQKQNADYDRAIQTATLQQQQLRSKEPAVLAQLKSAAAKKLLDIQNQIDQANKDYDDQTTKVYEAQANYQNAISLALTQCYKKLSDQGAKNRITYSSWNEAMSASQVGVTTYKCQRDFMMQQAQAAAWRAMNTAMMGAQSAQARIQSQIKNLQSQQLLAKEDAGNDAQNTVNDFTSQLAAAALQISQAQQAKAQNTQSCMQLSGVIQGKVSNDMANTSDESAQLRTEYCSLEKLQKIPPPYTARPKSDEPNMDELKDLQKIKDASVSDPCSDGCATELGTVDCPLSCPGVPQTQQNNKPPAQPNKKGKKGSAVTS